jgi:hypothetical protein
MANKIWIKDSSIGSYNCVIHTPTPAGNNSAGIPWSTVLVQVGLNVSVIPVNAVPTGFQQLAAEQAAVVAGTTAEIVAALPLDSANATPAQVTVLVNGLVSNWIAQMSAQYKWFGYVQ